MLKMVQMTAQEMNVKIPTESSVFFEEFETEVWAKQDTSVFNADYPNFAIASGQSSSVPGPAGLSDLIKTWGKLSFESPESKEEGEGDEENTGGAEIKDEGRGVEAEDKCSHAGKNVFGRE